MKENYLYKCILVVFLCYVVDSTISYFLPYNYVKEGLSIVPYTGLMTFSLLVNKIESPDRYFFAAICGTYYAIVYTNSLAIYILVYALIAFVRSYIIKVKLFSLEEVVLYFISTICLCEFIVYWLMIVTNTTQYPMMTFLLYRLLPTIGLNLILSLFVYWFYNKYNIEVR